MYAWSTMTRRKSPDCSSNPARLPTLHPRPRADLVKTAQGLVEQLAKGDYAAALAAFDPVLKASVSEDVLKQSWQQLIDQLGAYQAQTGTQTGTVQSYQAVWVTCQFKNGSMDVQVLFNVQDRVVGMQFVPAGTGLGHAAALCRAGLCQGRFVP